MQIATCQIRPNDSLEWIPASRFLSRVPSSRFRVGVRAGLVSAAATAGAITGFGVRHNDWSGPFASLGSQVMAGLGVAVPLPIVTGFAAHAAWMIVWGVIFAAAAHRRSPPIVLGLAVVVVATATIAARTILPAAMGAVRFAVLPGAQAALCCLLMSAGLVTGRALAGSD